MPGLTRAANQFHIAGPEVIDHWDAVVGAIEPGRLVKINSATEVEKTGAGDVNAIGIADRDLTKAKTATYAIGDSLPVRYLINGAVEVMVAGAVIAVGARVQTGADGKIVTYVVPAIATDTEVEVVGIALQAAGADLDEIAVLVAR